MSNANRIVARNPLNPENLAKPGVKQFRRTGITVYRGISKAGRHYYHSGDNIPASLPYVCAVSRRPYNGNSDRMKRGQP